MCSNYVREKKNLNRIKLELHVSSLGYNSCVNSCIFRRVTNYCCSVSVVNSKHVLKVLFSNLFQMFFLPLGIRGMLLWCFWTLLEFLWEFVGNVYEVRFSFISFMFLNILRGHFLWYWWMGVRGGANAIKGDNVIKVTFTLQ